MLRNISYHAAKRKTGPNKRIRISGCSAWLGALDMLQLYAAHALPVALSFSAATTDEVSVHDLKRG